LTSHALPWLGCAPGASAERAERRALESLEGAELSAARGDLGSAETGYREALAVWPDDPRVLGGLTRVLADRGALEAAVEMDDRARAVGGKAQHGLAALERCRLWLSAAVARLEARPGRSGAAAELLSRLDVEPACAPIDAASTRADVAARAAERSLASGDVDAAIAAWQRAIAHDPARDDFDARLARVLLDEGRRDAALTALSGGLERHPESRDLQSLMLEALGVPGLPVASEAVR
jgi:tetratricopeptide (TPR) repeat protein